MTRRVSRRAFIAGAGAGAIATAGGTAALLATRGDSRPRTAIPEPTVGPSPSPIPGASPVAPSQKRGGIATITSPSSFDFDTFDSQITGSSSVVEILGRTHSRLLNWDGRGEPALVPDLAASWEQPDDTSVIFRLQPSAKWQDRPPLNGRPVSADDVVLHFRRALELAVEGGAPLAQHYRNYLTIELVDSPGPGLVRFRTKQRDRFLFDTLAGEYALIQAPEAVAAFAGLWSKLDSDHVVGTGPWLFDWADNGAKLIASPAGHRQPFLDELRVWEPRDNVERFLSSEVHEVIIRDRREAEAIRAQVHPELLAPPGDLHDATQLADTGKTFEFHRFEREIVMSSFFIGAPPWNHPALIGAISGALNRAELSKRLFGGRAEAAQPVPLPGLTGQVSAERLLLVPGYEFSDGPYRPNPAHRLQWQAAGGPGLGPVTIDFPSVFDPLYSASSIVVGMLNEALGDQFRPGVESYTTISRKVIEGYYGNGRAAFWLGWGPALATPLAERYLAETYDRDSPAQRVTGGRGTAWSTEEAILNIVDSAYFGIVPWVQQYSEVFRRPGHIAPYPTPFWTQHLDYVRGNI